MDIKSKEINLERLDKLIESNNVENQYLATCLIRQNKDKLNYRDLIKKIPISSRIHSLKDIWIETNSSSDILLFKSPQNAFERYINACILIPKIVEAYNEDWFPNWNDTGEYKYFPYFEQNALVWSVSSDDCWDDVSTLPGSHYYKNREILMKACRKFQDIYNDWLNYVK